MNCLDWLKLVVPLLEESNIYKTWIQKTKSFRLIRHGWESNTRLISQKSKRRVWNWFQVAQNRDVQRVFVNKRVRLVTCKGEVILISRSTAGLPMTASVS